MDHKALGIIKNYAITEEQVREFHEKFGHPCPNKPTMCTPGLTKLRVKLIDEELTEVTEALTRNNMADVLKELCDLQYVVDGFFVSLGLDAVKEEAFMLVHQSNMSKLGPDGKPTYREDGKVLKGPNYKPVDNAKLEAILKKAGHKGD